MHQPRLLLLFGLLWLIGDAPLAAQRTVKGRASYYHDRFHGRKMANGNRYHRDSLTCAHLTYPLGMLVRVHNPRNGREVIVEVTDRGPYSRTLTIDLSRAAARYLGYLHQGVIPVEITPLGMRRGPLPPGCERFDVCLVPPVPVTCPARITLPGTADSVLMRQLKARTPLPLKLPAEATKGRTPWGWLKGWLKR